MAPGDAVSVEEALEAAIIAVVGAEARVREVLGDPLRVEEAGSPRPLMPYLEVVRHEVRPAGSLGVEATEHLVDFAVVSRDLGGRLGRAAVAAMRGVLDDAELMLDGGQCVLLLTQFTDTMRTRPGLWRSLIRVRAVVEEEG